MIKLIRNKWNELFHSFPLKKNDSGYYPMVTNKEGECPCPNCGKCSMARKAYGVWKCNYCMNTYRDMGIMGWELL